ncbi:MAG: DUF5312 family protein [Treponema sp.]|jgi:hypothetical protein|nr:DUF5312 family protein [Treponema sp.]
MAEDIFGKVFSLISGDKEPDSKKEIILKQIFRNLSQNRYLKFYKIRSEELEPAFAQCIYDFYKVIAPAIVLVRDSSRLAQLKSIALEAFMPPPALEIARRLNSKAIAEREKDTSSQILALQLEEDLNALVSQFDEAKRAGVNEGYVLATSFVQAARFDYPALLKRFDPSFRDAFGYQPKFSGAAADGLVAALSALLGIFPYLNPGRDWANAFKLLKICFNGAEPVPLDQWIAKLREIWDVYSSKVLEYIVQYTMQDPIWQGTPLTLEERLGEVWLEAKKKEIRRIIEQKVHRERKNTIESLASSLFGTCRVSRLANYTIKIHESLVERDLIGFTLAAEINYLAAFCQDYVNQETQDLFELLLIRGHWAVLHDSRNLSDAYYQLKDKIAEINAFDDALSESGKDGMRVKSALSRMEREKSQIRYLNTVLNGINEEAQELIDAAMPAVEALGKHLKDLAGDIQKKAPSRILNWRELGSASKLPIAQQIGGLNEKFQTLLALMVFFKSGPEE